MKVLKFLAKAIVGGIIAGVIFALILLIVFNTYAIFRTNMVITKIANDTEVIQQNQIKLHTDHVAITAGNQMIYQEIVKQRTQKYNAEMLAWKGGR